MIPIIPFDECYENWGDTPLHETNVCAGASGISTCFLDSGSALRQENEIVGIASWFFAPCGQVNAPSMYVRVSAYIDWIDNIIANISAKN